MAGASTPANPGTPTTAPARKGIPGLDPAKVIHYRSKATGQEAEFLQEAGVRLESVAAILAALALGHVPADMDVVLPPVIAVLDDAAKFVHLAGDQ
jgi:hypothetical protein